MDRRSHFHFRSRQPQPFVRGRPVVQEKTSRFLFGENRSSCDGAIHLKPARPGFRLFRPTGYFGAPFRDLRMATVLRILPALMMALTLWGALVAGSGAANHIAGAVVRPKFAVEAPAV
jgi:hypothetical protein